MTENEAIDILLQILYDEKIGEKGTKAFQMAMKSLEEVQQYRALEEKLNGITAKEVVEHFIKTVENQTEEEYTKGRILTNKEAEEWEQMKAIGTVAEFRELKANEVAIAKATAKRKCPNCNELLSDEYRFCPTCSRKVDLSEGKE